MELGYGEALEFIETYFREPLELNLGLDIHTLHSHSLVVCDSGLRQSTLLQSRAPIDIQRDFLVHHDRSSEVTKGIRIRQVNVLLDVNLRAIVRLDTGNSDSRERRSGTTQRNRSIESVDLGMIRALGAKDLSLIELKRFRCRVTDDHLFDIECGVIDSILSDLGVSDVNAEILSVA